MNYEKFLKTAPKNHNSQKFLNWLDKNNKTIKVTPFWIGYENIRLSTKNNPCYVFFLKEPKLLKNKNSFLKICYDKELIKQRFKELSFFENALKHRSIKREHFHLVDYSMSNFIDEKLKTR